MEESRTAVTAALLGNAALALLKGTSAVFTGSAAMLAETFHSIADTGNQTLLFLGMRLARRPPDEAHPFGHGKNVYFWSFVVSMMLFTLGGAFSIWEAVRHYLHPFEKTPTIWAYGVLAGSFFFESISLTVAAHGLRRNAGSRSLRQYWRDSRDPTLVTVLMEDSAALVALLIAAAGLWLTQTTGDGIWDAAASGLIGLLLIAVAIVLAVESHSLLIGERAPAWIERTIREVVASETAVTRLVELHTMHLGPRAVLIVLGVTFDDHLSADGVGEAVAQLQRRLAERLGDLTTERLIVIEPTPAPARRPAVAAAGG
jgi:cation diffusion facilitator family transporter